MPMLGMDIESVQNLVNALNTAADNEIPQIITQISTALNNAQWVGSDRNNFESDWNGTHVAQLRQLAEVLRSVSQHAQNEIQQQEQASAS